MKLPAGRRIRSTIWTATCGALLLTILPTADFASASLTAAPQKVAAIPNAYHSADVDLIHHYIDEITTKLGGVHLTPGVNVVESSATLGPDDSDANTICHGPGGDSDDDVPVTQCTITIYMDARSSASDTTDQSAKIHAALAHETFHMFQFQMAGSAIDLNALGKWVVEGSAAWVQTDLVKDPTDYEEFWQKWLNSPVTPLFSRTYTAIGFYAHLASTGISPWSRFAAIFSAHGNTAEYNAAVGYNQAFLDNWASVYFRNPGWGTEWDQDGQNSGFADDNVPSKATVGYSVPQVTAHAAGASPLVLTAKAYAAGAWDVSLGTDITKITVMKGTVRIHSYNNNSVDQLLSGSLSFCSASNPTSCAMCDAPSELPQLTDVAIAATGGSTGAEVDISTTKAGSTPCPTTPASSSSNNNNNSPGYSEGDPHLANFNGGSYDFQGAGEFTLADSSVGGFDVQVREQQQKESHFAQDVAWNTAVAMLVGTNKVEFDPGSPITVLVNGKAVHKSGSKQPPSSDNLSGGGTIAVKAVTNGEQATVTWPDGSKAEVFADKLGENVSVFPSVAIRSSLSGLLDAWVTPPSATGTSGAATTAAVTSTSAMETLLGGDGLDYTLDPTTKSGFQTLYGPFANSWRVTDSQSLFTYPKGKSTSSYTNKKFPQRLLSVNSFSNKVKKQAESDCTDAGIKKGPLFTDCVLDEEETGLRLAATVTAWTQKAVAEAPPKKAGWGKDVSIDKQKEGTGPGIAQHNANLSSVSCPTSTFCAAVDDVGDAFTYNGTVWASPVRIDKLLTNPDTDFMQTVSCTSPTFCVAGDTLANVFVYNGTTWSKPDELEPQNNEDNGSVSFSISCPTTTFCMAVDSNPDWLTFNGTTWTTAKAIDSSNTNSLGTEIGELSCSSMTFCMAAFGSKTVTYNGSTWSAPISIASQKVLSSSSSPLLRAISCVSATFCAGGGATGDNKGYLATFNGTSWSKPDIITSGGGPQSIDAMSCSSATFCMAPGLSGWVTWGGSSWSDVQVFSYKGATVLGGPQYTNSVSCPIATFCAEVEPNGLVNLWT